MPLKSRFKIILTFLWIIFLGIFFLFSNLCYAQYSPYYPGYLPGYAPYGYATPYSQFGYGYPYGSYGYNTYGYSPYGYNPYGAYGIGTGVGLYGGGYGGAFGGNIPVATPFSFSYVDSINFTMPIGYGTNSSFGNFAPPYPFSLVGWGAGPGSYPFGLGFGGLGFGFPPIGWI